jgi:hypothetical protein
MRLLNIQFQPHRAPKLSPKALKSLVSAFASKSAIVQEFSFEHGQDRGPYINFFLSARAKDLPKLWNSLRRQLLVSSPHSSAIRKSCMVLCQGSRGWDNYLLLAHFDPEVLCDTLSVA